jgi:hypothetical protein
MSHQIVPRISLVISDVDGTLVTTDKSLTPRSREAVLRLSDAGIAFSVISSRPPFGLRTLVDALSLRLPIGAYNGGALVTPDLETIEQTFVPSDVAEEALTVFRDRGVDAWIFRGDGWIVEASAHAMIERETRTVGIGPTIVNRLDIHLDSVSKMVGVSDDFARLTACEPILSRTLHGRASVARSQPYYLDITPAGTNKGVAVTKLAVRLGIPVAEIATIGDMENDVAMFRSSGFSIAMGNAPPSVKSCADETTLSNDEDGFAAAMERLILPRIRPEPP